MSPVNVEFVGRWLNVERQLVQTSVAGNEEYLGKSLEGPWVFEKKDAGEFSATQPALFTGKATATRLGDLLEKVRRLAAAAADLSGRGSGVVTDVELSREGVERS